MSSNFKEKLVENPVDVLAEALRNLKTMEGQEGYRQDHDKALHLVIALKAAGLKIVKAPAKRS
jgi:hypothetical protein